MFRNILSRISNLLIIPIIREIQNKLFSSNTNIEQTTLSILYKQQYYSECPPLKFKDVGFKVHSQYEEDGILLFIFSIIGTTNKKCVEICAGDGIECNTANLIINHRWEGLLFDNDERNIRKCEKYYRSNPNTRHWPPTIVKKWVTKDNADSAIMENGFSGEIDLLSIDIDGIDYWLWKAISCVSPRVVVLEFNHLWGPTTSVTVPYKEDFVAEFTRYGSDYAGASLSAFVKLGKEKGYRLVGTNEISTNAFFVRDDIKCKWLPAIDTSTCFSHSRAQFGINSRLPNVKDKKWIKV